MLGTAITRQGKPLYNWNCQKQGSRADRYTTGIVTNREIGQTVMQLEIVTNREVGQTVRQLEIVTNREVVEEPPFASVITVSLATWLLLLLVVVAFI